MNVSSVVGETGNIGQANYAASKSGLFGLTKTLAKEAAYQLAKSGKRTDDGIGITVNTVTPGLIATEMTAGIPEKVMAKLTSQIPVGRAGRPEEVARVVHFLAADVVLLHHRTGLECQRRHGHVTRPQLSALWWVFTSRSTGGESPPGRG